MFAYCLNNPVKYQDIDGHIALTTGIILTGGVIGGILGAFNALCTGGNVPEGFIEGILTGVVGSWAGVTGHIYIASYVNVAIDCLTQLVFEDQVNLGRIIKSGFQTYIGAKIPPLRNYSDDVIEAIGTAILWSEGSAVLNAADVVVENTSPKPQNTQQQTFAGKTWVCPTGGGGKYTATCLY